MGLLDRAKQKMRGLLTPEGGLDFTRGLLMGGTTDVLGYPVDVVSDAMRPFGYDVPREQTVGSSDWLAGKLTSPTGSGQETAGRVLTGLLTPGPQELLQATGLLKKSAPVQELTVYHGSPHRINNVDEANPAGKFDLSKIGTGEGAQAYGHGIYLAENPGVAKSYMFAGLGNQWYDTSTAKYGNRSIDKLYESANRQKDMMDRARVSVDNPAYKKALAEAQFWEYLMTHQHPAQAINSAITNADDWPELADFARKLDPKKFTGVPERQGNFYTVDLPDEHIAKMLDWDAPLSEQPEAVKEAIKKTTFYDGGRAHSGESVMKWPGMTGRHIYDLIVNRGNEYKTFREVAPEASAAWQQLGIPGIKYADGGSRGSTSVVVRHIDPTDSGLYVKGWSPTHGQSVKSASKETAKVFKTKDEAVKWLEYQSRKSGGEPFDVSGFSFDPAGTRNFVIFSGDTAKILKRE